MTQAEALARGLIRPQATSSPLPKGTDRYGREQRLKVPQPKSKGPYDYTWSARPSFAVPYGDHNAMVKLFRWERELTDKGKRVWTAVQSHETFRKASAETTRDGDTKDTLSQRWVTSGRSLEDCAETRQSDVKGMFVPTRRRRPFAPMTMGTDNIRRPPDRPLPEKRSGYRSRRNDD